jgi:hypothetical protein
MSKKDKKRIAELERQQSILSAKIRVMREQQVTLRDNFILHLLEEHSQIFEQGSIPQSEPKQPEAAKDSPTMDGATFGKLERGESVLPQSILNKPKFNKANFDKLRGGIFCNNTKMPDPTLDKSEQKQPEFSEQVSPNIDYYVTREDGRIMEQKKDGYYTWWVHGTYMPYTSFSGPKQAIDAIEKYIKFAYYRADKDTTIPTLNDFGITKISRMKPSELAQGSDGADSPTRTDTGQPKIYTLEPQKAALIKTVLDRVKEMEKLLANPNLGVGELTFFIDDWAKELQLDLADFRRKVLDLGRVEPSKVEPKEAAQDEPKQDSPTPPELEQGKVWIIQTNPKKEGLLNSLYVDYVGGDGIVRHTTNPNEAMNFAQYIEAGNEIGNIVVGGKGRYNIYDFKIVRADAKQPENEAEQVETEPEKWCIYNKANNSLVLIADEKHCQYNSKEEAENGICKLHNCGLISGKFEQYDTVLVSEILKRIEQKEAEESEPILPAPEQKEADESGSELGGTWLIYDKIDKAWAAKCSEGGFYWSSEQDDFVLKFTSESEAKQRYDALCSRGLISRMHRANSGVIRKE